MDDFDYDDEIDPYEEALNQCGIVEGGLCMMAGTEYCDLCPFRDE